MHKFIAKLRTSPETTFDIHPELETIEMHEADYCFTMDKDATLIKIEEHNHRILVEAGMIDMETGAWTYGVKSEGVKKNTSALIERMNKLEIFRDRSPPASLSKSN